jgi:DNA repair protein RecO (recombination protein O)
MMVRDSEAIILRTFPFQEADKIVSFFSREEGRTRGVAQNARRSIKRFGASLELMSHVRIRYQERPNRDLVRVDSCELLDSFFDTRSNYDVAVAISYLTEVCERMLPEREPNDPFFRLVLLVMEEFRRTGKIWRVLTYFDLWTVKLAGLLPPLSSCQQCHSELATAETAWFRSEWNGLLCGACKGEDDWVLHPASRSMASHMLTDSLTGIPEKNWEKKRAGDLRRFLGQQMEHHMEGRLITRRQLEQIS